MEQLEQNLQDQMLQQGMPNMSEGEDLSAGQQAPNQEPQNPYDSTQEQSALEQLQQELEQTTSSIDSDFAKFYAENMPTNVEELFYEDRAEFLLEVEKAKQAYLEERIMPLQQKKGELEQNIASKQNNSSIWEAQITFTKKYPDVDFNEILEFYNEELSNKQKEELQQLGDIGAIYEEVLNIMQVNAKNAKKQARGKLPTDTSDAQFANRSQLDEDIAKDSDLPINRR